MLIGFSFNNFASFYNECFFSALTIGGDSRFRGINTKETPHGELLKSAFIFGANASGKTNFIKAMQYFRDVVNADLVSQSAILSAKRDWNFVLHKEARNEPSAFNASFIVNDTMYEYGFEVTNGEISSEYLYRKFGKKKAQKTIVFKRNNADFSSIEFGNQQVMDNVRKLTSNVRKSNLFLSWAVVGNDPIAAEVAGWFQKLQIIVSKGNGINARTPLFFDTIQYGRENDVKKQNVLKLVKQANPTITDYFIASRKGKMTISTSDDQPNVDIDSFDVEGLELHFGYKHYKGGQWEETGEVAQQFPEALESAGTVTIFELAGPILKALENGSPVFLDELDSGLHPALVRYIVALFNSVGLNPKGAQLICNTHDVMLLDEDIRRDQICFVEKDNFGRSELSFLTDYKGIRSDSNILKKYLLGAFGATPKLSENLGLNFGLGE